MTVYHSCPRCGNDDAGCGIDRCINGHVYCDQCSVYTDNDELGTSCPICGENGSLIGEIKREPEKINKAADSG